MKYAPLFPYIKEYGKLYVLFHIYFYVYTFMIKIITTTKVQKNIGELSGSITETSFIVTKHGQGKIVMLPYFDGCDENISEYLEDFQMALNKKKLDAQYKKSIKSGESSLKV